MNKLLIAALCLFSTSASATDIYGFYGASGNYEGSATVNDSRVIYHGSSGELLGSSTTVGPQTNFYGSSGDYLGHIKENYSYVD